MKFTVTQVRIRLMRHIMLPCTLDCLLCAEVPFQKPINKGTKTISDKTHIVKANKLSHCTTIS